MKLLLAPTECLAVLPVMKLGGSLRGRQYPRALSKYVQSMLRLTQLPPRICSPKWLIL